jgi:hypothetical protein
MTRQRDLHLEIRQLARQDLGKAEAIFSRCVCRATCTAAMRSRLGTCQKPRSCVTVSPPVMRIGIIRTCGIGSRRRRSTTARPTPVASTQRLTWLRHDSAMASANSAASFATVGYEVPKLQRCRWRPLYVRGGRSSAVSSTPAPKGLAPGRGQGRCSTELTKGWASFPPNKGVTSCDNMAWISSRLKTESSVSPNTHMYS